MGIITLMLFTMGSFLGAINYNYEIDKCSSMTRQTSNYDFTHTVELDANYNQHCFYYQNHPLALFCNILKYSIIFVIISMFIWSV